MTKKKRKTSKNKSNKSIWLFSFLLFGVIAFAWFWYKTTNSISNQQSKFIRQFPEGFKGIGIDVSHHQGEIDWTELLVKRNFDTLIDFVYCKATEGSDHLDTQWKNNRKALNKLGILNGAYHYFNPKGAPKPQANFFLKNYTYRSIDIPPVLDVEDEGYSDKDLIEKIKIWCIEVKKTTDVQPIIYTSLNFYETKFRGKLPDYYFWIAAYSRTPQYLSDPQVLHWQFSETGTVPTIKNAVDLNVSNADFD